MLLEFITPFDGQNRMLVLEQSLAIDIAGIQIIYVCLRSCHWKAMEALRPQPTKENAVLLLGQVFLKSALLVLPPLAPSFHFGCLQTPSCKNNHSVACDCKVGVFSWFGSSSSCGEDHKMGKRKGMGIFELYLRAARCMSLSGGFNPA